MGWKGVVGGTCFRGGTELRLCGKDTARFGAGLGWDCPSSSSCAGLRLHIANVESLCHPAVTLPVSTQWRGNHRNLPVLIHRGTE